MRKVTIELSDKDVKWLENNERNIAWFSRQKVTPSEKGIERRVIAKIARSLVDGNEN